MAPLFQSSRDVILRTDGLDEAVRFYSSVLGLPISHKGANMMGFDAGAFTLYVESGDPHGPVFEFLVPDIPAAKSRLLAQGCVVVEEDLNLPRCYLRDPYGLTFNIRLDRTA
jgi:catechol 2,3-dioxygenase-like lactoylglutathione lyase family enzyme